MWSRLWSSSASGILKRTLLAANTQSLTPPPRCATTRTIASSVYSSSYYYYSGRGRGGAGAAADASTPLCKITSFCFSSAIVTGAETSSPSSDNNNNNNILITSSEAKRLMRLVNVEALKMKLGMESKEIIPFSDLLEACQSIGIARSHDEAVATPALLFYLSCFALFAPFFPSTYNVCS
ncbi:hypothetical protein OIU79_024237 [Salix purpurea]|uniref:Calcium uniporter protein n=1 Tax=Salix purpurea TaxID=77065 RepID=A0A9Q1AAA2_SALPP|nr:hypothetical protein OIU79_024237 [Salix purpurea]